jgi:hypothetical protein
MVHSASPDFARSVSTFFLDICNSWRKYRKNTNNAKSNSTFRAEHLNKATKAFSQTDFESME